MGRLGFRAGCGLLVGIFEPKFQVKGVEKVPGREGHFVFLSVGCANKIVSLFASWHLALMHVTSGIFFCNLTLTENHSLREALSLPPLAPQQGVANILQARKRGQMSV